MEIAKIRLQIWTRRPRNDNLPILVNFAILTLQKITNWHVHLNVHENLAFKLSHYCNISYFFFC